MLPSVKISREYAAVGLTADLGRLNPVQAQLTSKNSETSR